MADDKVAEVHGPPLRNRSIYQQGVWASFRGVIEANPDKIALTSIHQPWDQFPALGLKQPHPTGGSLAPPPGCFSPCFKLSYAELDRASQLVATYLHSRNAAPGSSVMLCINNRAEWAITWWAVLRLGAVFVPINPMSVARREEMEHFLATSKPACVIVQSLEARQTIDDMCPGGGPSMMTVEESCEDDGCITFNRVLEEASTMSPCPQYFSGPHEPCILLYTSGTTSLPKPVVLSNLQSSGAAPVRERLPWLDSLSLCHFLPVQHIFATLFSLIAWITAGTVVFPSTSFEPEKALYALAAEKCNFLGGVPAMKAALMSHTSADKYVPHVDIQFCLLGGSNVTTTLVERMKKRFRIRTIVAAYGMTECCPITYWDPKVPQACNGVGTVLADVSVRIVDPETCKTLARGEAGELQAASCLAVSRYGNDSSPETFVEGEDMHGVTRKWLRTGDQAMIDNDGVIHILGRIKDIIIRGGENLSASRIESVLEELPGIKVAQVVGAAHAVYGEVPVAVVEYTDGQEELGRAIHRHVAEKLGPDSAPVQAFTLADLGLKAWPMTLSRKVQKRTLVLAVDAFFARVDRGGQARQGATTLETVRSVWTSIVPMASSISDDDPELPMLVNSLDFMAFIGTIRKLLGKTITLEGIQANPTMAMQARLIDACGASKTGAYSETVSFRALPGRELEARQIIHLTSNARGFTFQYTKTLAMAAVQRVDKSLAWSDVESMLPMNSMAKYLQTSRRPRSACHRQEIRVSRPVSKLRQGLLRTIEAHEMMRCLSTKLDDKWSVLIALKYSDKILPLLIQTASIKSYADIETLQVDDGQDGVQPPGLHNKFTIVELQDDPSQSALVSWSHHSMFDFQSLRSLYESLDAFIADPTTPLPSPLPSLVPFAHWIYQRELTSSGAADVKYHVKRLAGIGQAKNRWPPQRSPEWMRGCDNGWRDVRSGLPGKGRKSLGGDTSTMEAGVVSKAMAVKLQHLPRFRSTHRHIFPAMMVKAALATFNMAESGTGQAIFAQFENGRYATADLPADLDITKVDGPVMEMLVNRIKVDPGSTTALQLMELVQKDQLEMTSHAHANVYEIMASMRRGEHGATAEDAEVFDDALRRQFFNWFSDFESREPPRCTQRTRTSGHGDLGVLWNIGPRKDDVLWLATPYDFCQLTPDEARRASQRFLSAAQWFSDPDNAAVCIAECSFDSADVYDC